ncbi:MAG: nucleotidyltransferase domain-containing protein, partial [Rhodospirillales bacterium]|nr:nucleotidyltransferase domain-containing protein [Rhodospirillales bacterium]
MAGAVLPSESDIAALCARWKMRALSIFGSVARGEARPDSDIDLLVDFEPGADWSLSDRERLREEAAALFGRPADIVEARNVTNPYRRAAIQRDIAQWGGAAPPRSMTPRERDPAHLHDMMDWARDAAALRARITRGDLDGGSHLGPAAERGLDKLGHAAAKVSAATRADHPTIPWD